MKTDLALLHRYHHHGDAGAFAELVRTHAGMVYATAQRVTRDAALAEDVAQEVFLKLARASHQAIECVGAWLHHVTRQRACDAIRSKVTRQRYEPAAEHWHDSMCEPTWAEIEPIVDEVLDALPEECRSLLVEHFLEQRAQQEIARQLGVSQSTISRKIEVALQTLRDGLAKRGVLCGTCLAGLLTSHSTQAAPVALETSLHKIGLSGAGVGAGTGAAGSLITSSTFATMTATTKSLLVLGTAAALIGIPFLLPKSDPPVLTSPPVGSAPSSPQPREFATFTPSSKSQDQPRSPAQSQTPAAKPVGLASYGEKQIWKEAMASESDRELILADYVKHGGKLRDEYLEIDLQTIVQKVYGGDLEALERELHDRGMTLEQFKEKRRRDIITNVMKVKITNGIVVGDARDGAKAKQAAYEGWLESLRRNAAK